MTIPNSWTTIAVFSANENRFVPAPGAIMTQQQAVLRENVATRTATVRGQKLFQIKAK